MTFVPAAVVLLSSMLWLGTASAFAQGGATSSISGVVRDAGGGVLPGATVVTSSTQPEPGSKP